MKVIIELLEKITEDYAQRLCELSEEDISCESAPGKWSGKEYLGHLVDSAQNNIRRFVVAQYESKPHIIYNQDKWVEAAGYRNYPTEDLINLWVLLNKHIVIILKRLSCDMEEKEVMTESVRTIKWLAADYNKHLLHHLHQILKMTPMNYP